MQNIPINETVVKRWEPIVHDIPDAYVRAVTAQLLENQALANTAESLKEDSPTTVGKLGTFQKFSFPLIRRVFPKLIANSIVATQPMNSPTSQIFYLGSTRVGLNGAEQLYSKYKLTYKGLTTNPILSGANLAGSAVASGFAMSSVYAASNAGPLATFGGKIAAFPNSATILGYSVSAGEALSGNQIPEMNIHIQQQPVSARTRKLRALWTIEASQDLKAYHNLALESELTNLLTQELRLEIDRELIEDLRTIAYNPSATVGGWEIGALDFANSNNFTNQGQFHPTPNNGTTTESFIPVSYLYDFAASADVNPFGKDSNVFAIDLGVTNGMTFAPQHIGHVYSNLLAVINFASQDIFKTTHRGPGTWMLTSPVIGALLESAAKLEGGLPSADGPTNMGKNVQFRGKFAGKYDLYIDPLYPEDEILMGYKGNSPMDTGFVYCPYIPLQQLPTVVDPQTFQPRKGLLTRYGKAAVAPASRFYRIIRIIGPVANFLFLPFARNINNSNG